MSLSFDRILADVPCSGTGTLARNPEIKWRLKIEDLLDLQARQVAILKSALARLARNGRLVYSTCSLEREENEAVVEMALGGSAEFKIVDCKEEFEQLRQIGRVVLERYCVASRRALSPYNSGGSSVRWIFRRRDRTKVSDAKPR